MQLGNYYYFPENKVDYIEITNSTYHFFVDVFDRGWYKVLPEKTDIPLTLVENKTPIEVTTQFTPAQPMIPINIFAKNNATNQQYITLPHLILNTKALG